jgi:NAD(P)-dependent dehydrogenase (short-subunit alcohol dehydrogenase family)
MTSIVLILGAGAKVGKAVAKAFQAKGYKLALASRSQDPRTSTDDELHIPTDCSDTDSVVQAFAKTRSVFGHPNVVIYNGKSTLSLIDTFTHVQQPMTLQTVTLKISLGYHWMHSRKPPPQTSLALTPLLRKRSKAGKNSLHLASRPLSTLVTARM